MEKKSSYKELEQRKVDRDLFGLLYPLFDCMSRKGQEATIETLSYIIGIKEEIRKRRNK